MKYLLIILVLTASTACMAVPAQPVTQLTWVNPTTLIDGTPYNNKGGSKIYCDATNTGTSVVIDVPDPALTSYLLENISLVCGVGPKTVGMTAYDSLGVESPLSNVKTYVEVSGVAYSGDIPAAPRIE